MMLYRHLSVSGVDGTLRNELNDEVAGKSMARRAHCYILTASVLAGYCMVPTVTSHSLS